MIILIIMMTSYAILTSFLSVLCRFAVDAVAVAIACIHVACAPFLCQLLLGYCDETWNSRKLLLLLERRF